MTSRCADLYVFPLCALLCNPNTKSQKFDFAFEEEESMDGMKRMIVDEVNAFRSMVRQQARAAGNAKRQDT